MQADESAGVIHTSARSHTPTIRIAKNSRLHLKRALNTSPAPKMMYGYSRQDAALRFPNARVLKATADASRMNPPGNSKRERIRSGFELTLAPDVELTATCGCVWAALDPPVVRVRGTCEQSRPSDDPSTARTQSRDRTPGNTGRLHRRGVWEIARKRLLRRSAVVRTYGRRGRLRRRSAIGRVCRSSCLRRRDRRLPACPSCTWGICALMRTWGNSLTTSPCWLGTTRSQPKVLYPQPGTM